MLNDNVAPEKDTFDHFYNKIEKIRDYSHFRAWKKTEWLRMLEDENFEIHELHRFEKYFEFEDWCARMHLSVEEKETLTNLMLEADDDVKQKFRIRHGKDNIESFQGEAVLLSCIKC